MTPWLYENNLMCLNCVHFKLSAEFLLLRGSAPTCEWESAEELGKVHRSPTEQTLRGWGISFFKVLQFEMCSQGRQVVQNTEEFCFSIIRASELLYGCNFFFFLSYSFFYI